MNRRSTRSLLSVLFVVMLALTGIVATTSAQTDEPMPPIWTPGVFTDPSWLTVDFHRVSATINDQLATTRIDLQFTNTGEGLAEGTARSEVLFSAGSPNRDA